MTKKEKGIIVNEGMGGFLNPPGHPEHYYSVEFNLRRRKENRNACSLTYAAYEASFLDDSIRKKAKKILDDWKTTRPSLSTPEIQDWIHQVLGYFKNCYSPDGVTRDASKCVIISGNPFEIGVNRHLGVMFIRQFYPEYKPTKRILKKLIGEVSNNETVRRAKGRMAL